MDQKTLPRHSGREGMSALPFFRGQSAECKKDNRQMPKDKQLPAHGTGFVVWFFAHARPHAEVC
ncbi:MAG TPA: hypothetical protein VH370_02560 [Humisphaera sp.]|jgi:hypothetical protein|nr:hypothetical protein [Humisphaera sp.]